MYIHRFTINEMVISVPLIDWFTVNEMVISVPLIDRFTVNEMIISVPLIVHVFAFVLLLLLMPGACECQLAGQGGI
jgi:hypothetical protein